MKDTAKQHKTPGKAPNVHSEAGGINPSAPTTGTEGWGYGRDERDAVVTDPSGTRAGQMKGNPGDHMTAASQRESKRATTNDRPAKPGDKQPDLTRLTSASQHSMSISHGGKDHTFRCADAGNADCRWETSGTPDEIQRRAEAHGRRDHGMKDWTEAMRHKVRDATRRREAA